MPWAGRVLRQHIRQTVQYLSARRFTHTAPAASALPFSSSKLCLNGSQTQPTTQKKVLKGMSDSPAVNHEEDDGEERMSRILEKIKDGQSLSRIMMKGGVNSALLSQLLQNRDEARKLAEAIAQTRYPRQARGVLQMACKLGTPLKQNAYECLVHQLALKGGHWHLIPSVVSLGLSHTGRTTVRLLNWQTHAYLKMRDYKRLEGVLDEFERHGLKPNRSTFHFLISGHTRNRNLWLARKCMMQMEAAGFPVDSSTHTRIVSAYRSLGPDALVQSRAFGALLVVNQPTATAILNGLLRLRLDALDYPGVIEVLSYFENKDLADLFFFRQAQERHVKSRRIPRYQIGKSETIFGENTTPHGGKRGSFSKLYMPIWNTS